MNNCKVHRQFLVLDILNEQHLFNLKEERRWWRRKEWIRRWVFRESSDPIGNPTNFPKCLNYRNGKIGRKRGRIGLENKHTRKVGFLRQTGRHSTCVKRSFKGRPASSPATRLSIEYWINSRQILETRARKQLEARLFVWTRRKWRWRGSPICESLIQFPSFVLNRNSFKNIALSNAILPMEICLPRKKDTTDLLRLSTMKFFSKFNSLRWIPANYNEKYYDTIWHCTKFVSNLYLKFKFRLSS